jgi:PIN domain nuclease of toxin-antitoxin system
VASVWEMQIKIQLGKLTLPLSLSDMITSQQMANGIEVIPITLVHTLALDSLPLHHRDPFDRILIVQANIEGAILLSKDTIFTHYPVTTDWQKQSTVTAQD